MINKSAGLFFFISEPFRACKGTSHQRGFIYVLYIKHADKIYNIIKYQNEFKRIKLGNQQI